MFVYLAMLREYPGQWDVVGVFSTEDKAQAYIQKQYNKAHYDVICLAIDELT